MNRQNTKDSAVILCGGDINYTSLPIGTNVSNSMVPINGKPVIAWILDDLIKKGINDVVIVLQERNKKLFNFTQWGYARRMNLSYAHVDKGGSIINSLVNGVEKMKDESRIHLVLGDTLIQDDFGGDEDFVYVGPNDFTDNWCLVNYDESGVVQEYHDKVKVKAPEFKILAGYYYLTDKELLLQSAEACLSQGRGELSAVLKKYGDSKAIKAKQVNQWFDFGHIGHLAEARRKLLQSRYFNSLEIDPIKGKITKSSLKSDKLLDELNWYRLLPEELKILAPRILDEKDAGDKTIITQEFYGYPNLAELYVFGDMESRIWFTAIDNLFNLHKLLCQYEGDTSSLDLEEIYRSKTHTRLEELKQNEQEWQSILAHSTIEINGESHKNLPGLMPKIEEGIDQLLENAKSTILHGDYCFSNILYDVGSQIVRLIDPRGSFGKRGIYGDPRYDIAKLRHSVNGKYDFILSDLFSLTHQTGSNTFEMTVFSNEVQNEVSAYLDLAIEENGYSLKEIKFIEGLLFLSMLPYHRGNNERQKMMYLRSIMLFNEIL